MKLLKIFSAILFFGFLGTAHNQLFAQEPIRNEGTWTRTLQATDYLENGEYRAKIQNDATKKSNINLIIYKKSNNAVVRTVLLSNSKENGTVESLGFDISSNTNMDVYLSYTTDGLAERIGNLHKAGRNDFSNLSGYKVLNTDIEVTKSAYFKLEFDGRFIIYHGTGVSNSAGTPILEL